MKSVFRIDGDQEYSLQREISDQITKVDKNSVAALMKNEDQRV